MSMTPGSYTRVISLAWKRDPCWNDSSQSMLLSTTSTSPGQSRERESISHDLVGLDGFDASRQMRRSVLMGGRRKERDIISSSPWAFDCITVRFRRLHDPRSGICSTIRVALAQRLFVTRVSTSSTSTGGGSAVTPPEWRISARDGWVSQRQTKACRMPKNEIPARSGIWCIQECWGCAGGRSWVCVSGNREDEYECKRISGAQFIELWCRRRI